MRAANGTLAALAMTACSTCLSGSPGSAVSKMKNEVPEYLVPYFDPRVLHDSYDGPVWLYRIALDQSEGVARLHDAVFRAEYCSREDSMSCVRSRLITFAVPKDSSVKEWRKYGLHFRVTGTSSFPIFGVPIEALLIHAYDGSHEWPVYQYMYSRERGLLAFGSVMDDGDTFHWYVSANHCGFAASRCE
jgi:hypothetical protein